MTNTELENKKQIKYIKEIPLNLDPNTQKCFAKNKKTHNEK